MNIQVVLRYAILVMSSLAMIAGILVMVGLLVPRNFPEQYGVIMGVVIFLYGAYRFALTYFRKAG